MYQCLKNQTGKGFYFIQKEKNRTSQNFVGEGERLWQKQDDLTENASPRSWFN